MTKLEDKLSRKREGQVNELGEKTEGRIGQHMKELSVLKDIASVVNQSLTLDQILQAITKAILKTVPSAQRVVIHLCSEAASLLVPIASAQRGQSRKPTPPTEIIQPIVRRAAEKQRRIHIPDLRKEARVPDGTDAPIQKGELSLLIVPLISDQKTVGTLSVYGTKAEAFADHDQCLTEVFAEWAAMAIKKTQLRFEAKQSQEAALTVPADQAASA